MRTPAVLLHSAIADTPSPAASLPLLLPAHAEEQQQQQAISISVDSDTVVILASLLCALICVAGLALVARCACRRGGGGGASVSVAAGGGGNSSGGRSSSQPPRGLEKAAIEALPTVSVSSSLNKLKKEDDKECAICLAAFAEGDQLRVLPRCAHGFHAACIDTWLAAHASCPSCRATIVSPSPSPPPLCRRCGAACCDLQDAMAAPEPAAAAAAAAGLPTPWPIHGASLSSSTSIH